MYHVAVEVRKTHLAAAKSKSASSVIDSQQMQDGRMQIMHLGKFLSRLAAPLVGGTLNHARFAPPPASQIVKPN